MLKANTLTLDQCGTAAVLPSILTRHTEKGQWPHCIIHSIPHESSYILHGQDTKKQVACIQAFLPIIMVRRQITIKEGRTVHAWFTTLLLQSVHNNVLHYFLTKIVDGRCLLVKANGSPSIWKRFWLTQIFQSAWLIWTAGSPTFCNTSQWAHPHIWTDALTSFTP